MKKFYRKLRVALAIIFFAPMLAMAQDPTPSPTPPPSVEIFGDAGTVGQTNLRNQLSGIAAALDPFVVGRKVSILVDDAIPVQYLNTNCWCEVRVVSDTPFAEAPDILLTEHTGVWSTGAGETAGYDSALVHMRYPHTSNGQVGPNGYRLLQINEDYSSVMPHYFPATTASTRIAVLSHIRGFIEYHPDLFALFAQVINAQNPDYVFIMGDMVFRSTDDEYLDLEQNLLDKFNVPYVFVPGNHEVRAVTGADTVYRTHIGPMPPVIITPTANILMINSTTILEEVELQLMQGFQEIKNAENLGKNTVLMTHHKPWEPYWVPNVNYIKPYFSPTNFMPLVTDTPKARIGKVDGIIDGDKYGGIVLSKQRDWDDVWTLSIGNGQKGSNAQLYYSMIELADDGVMRIEPYYLDLYANHPWYTVDDPRDNR